MKKSIFLLSFSLLAAASSFAQTALPRLFLDIPSFLVTSPDVENIDRLVGLDLGTAMNFGTHWGTARIGGGALLSVDVSSEKIGSTFLTTPYGMLEVGAGKYRSNGDQCAKTKSNAFTAMAKAGLRYNIDTRKEKPTDDGYGLDYTVGAEFGYFYIRDVFRNNEFVIQGNYHTKSKVISASIGFKMFLNLRADRG